MTEGTRSYLLGCHQFFFHPLWVLFAWRLEYKSWPSWWQIISILLHDVGICGRQYVSDEGAKEGHWFLGAIMAEYLVERFSKEVYPHGHAAFLFCAGHSPHESGYPKSLMFIPDKRSYLVAPMWWKWWNYWAEGFKIMNPIEWTELVRENLKSEDPMESYELYLSKLRG